MITTESSNIFSTRHLTGIHGNILLGETNTALGNETGKATHIVGCTRHFAAQGGGVGQGVAPPATDHTTHIVGATGNDIILEMDLSRVGAVRIANNTAHVHLGGSDV